MPYYRCYLLNGTDNIISVDTIRSEQGEEGALEQARDLLRTKYKEAHALEVWDRAILVGRIDNEVRPSTSIQSILGSS
jgi:hypothetical protein